MTLTVKIAGCFSTCSLLFACIHFSGCDKCCTYYDNGIARDFIITLVADETCDSNMLFHYSVDGELLDDALESEMPKSINIDEGDRRIRVYCTPIHHLKYWQVEYGVQSDSTFTVECNGCEF